MAKYTTPDGLNILGTAHVARVVKDEKGDAIKTDDVKQKMFDGCPVYVDEKGGEWLKRELIKQTKNEPVLACHGCQYLYAQNSVETLMTLYACRASDPRNVIGGTIANPNTRPAWCPLDSME